MREPLLDRSEYNQVVSANLEIGSEVVQPFLGEMELVQVLDKYGGTRVSSPSCSPIIATPAPRDQPGHKKRDCCDTP